MQAPWATSGRSAFGPAEFGLGIAAFLALALWRVPSWLVVVLGAGAAQVVGLAAR